MVNILTIDFSSITGPSKVVQNLIKGLNKIGYPYIINKDINVTPYCYIPNNRTALPYIKKTKSTVIVGPNLYVLPRDIPWFIDLNGCIYLQPCEWVVNLWKNCRSKLVLKVWPVGIDTDAFSPKNNQTKKKIAIYHKMRSRNELNLIKAKLQQMKLDYNLILYGKYSEQIYKEILQQTSLLIWHGRHESQGIALQEAMACNVPILVCDVDSLAEGKNGYSWSPSLFKFKVTAAPYFDYRCGIKISDLSGLEQTVIEMLDNLPNYHPRQYILENLSLQKQAIEFVAFFADSNVARKEWPFLNETNIKDFTKYKILFAFQVIIQKSIIICNSLSSLFARILKKIEWRIWKRSL